MKRKKHTKEYALADYNIDVVPILTIHVDQGKEFWRYTIVDINGSRNNRPWCIAKNGRYKSITKCAKDAEIAYENAKIELGIK